MKNPAKLWLAVFGVGGALITILLVITLLNPVPTGALTRIAQVSERDFGGRAPEPDIPFSRIRQSPLNEADVLVIGDSFSHYFAWQSELVAAGYRVATTHWDKVVAPCLDLPQWLKANGFNGQLVLLESIEYLMPGRLDAMRACKSMEGLGFSLSDAPSVSPSPPPPTPMFNTRARLMSGFTTWRHTRRIAQSPNEVLFDTERSGAAIFATSLTGGCQQFSHRMCEKNLFLEMDRSNPELQPNDAEFMHQYKQAVEQRARDAGQPLRVRWMMIPNKYTVYLDTARAQGFAQRARELDIGPDLFEWAQSGRREILDLYWPNDNHWSMKGQLFFGRHMLSDVNRSIGSAPQRG